MAWPLIEPGRPYVHGWHLDAIADHLTAVSNGEITRLLINVPPGTMKSLSAGVFWPTWEWGPLGRPHLRYVCASYAQELAVRDNIRARRLVKSDWYQARWPVPLAADQDAQKKFENAATGFRAAIASASMTGQRGDRVIIDDPHSVVGSLSDADRRAVLSWFTEAVPTRLNDPERSAIIVIMQRLHQEDVSGLILERELGYEHLMLPMEFEPDRRCRTSIGFVDPRTEPGELLFPARFPREVVERDSRVMGQYAAAGQFQQRPTPRGGGVFPVERFKIAPHAPERGAIERSIRYWDKAGTDAASAARTAGVLMHLLRDGTVCVGDVQLTQAEALAREALILQTAQIDGRGVEVYVEQEPGSGGKESAQATIRMLRGFRVYADRPVGDKEARADPFAAQVQAGNVALVAGAWNHEYIAEHRHFPAGKWKDQVDASAAAFNILTLAPRRAAGSAPMRGLI